MKIPEYCWKIIDRLIEMDRGRFYSEWVYKKKWYVFISRGYHNWSCEVFDLHER